ncbi:MAG TPA: tRNA lysidine(34) synthetase TilS [Syntrophaceticus sp.]|nr:tRNA lysidine(34) synthetase TilS [Syntrophaceticus sp.]
MPAFTEKVEQLLKRKNLISPEMRIVVGVSGGADSVALLSVLNDLAPKYSLKLYAAHLNHLLRKEAGEDAAFVQRFARSLGIPAFVGYARVSRLSRIYKLSIEEAGRKARYQFLRHVAKKVGAQRIAVGHHAGDQVETVIFHFLRGTGPAGITGIPLQNREIIRPLLGVTKEEIEEFCCERGLEWRTDATNLTTEYLRNRIRVELLPYLRRFFNPQVDRAVLQLADIMSAENEFLEDLAQRLLRKMGQKGREGEIRIRLSDFLSLPLAVQRRLLRLLIKKSGAGLKDVGYQHYDNCISFLQESRLGGEMHLPHSNRLFKESDYFWISAGGKQGKPAAMQQIKRDLKIPGITEIPELGVTIQAEIKPYQVNFNFPPENYQVCFDYDKIKLPLCVRTRQKGDRIRTFGLEGKKKLKKLFTELKIPLSERDLVPLVVSDGEICWVVGYKRGATAPVTEDTRQVLLLTAYFNKSFKS